MSIGYRLNEYWRFNDKAFASDLIKGMKFQTSFAYSFDLNATKKYAPVTPDRYNAEVELLKAGSGNNQLTDYW